MHPMTYSTALPTEEAVWPMLSINPPDGVAMPCCYVSHGMFHGSFCGILYHSMGNLSCRVCHGACHGASGGVSHEVNGPMLHPMGLHRHRPRHTPWRIPRSASVIIKCVSCDTSRGVYPGAVLYSICVPMVQMSDGVSNRTFYMVDSR